MFDNLKPGAGQASAQPTARHLAQMRLAAGKAGIPSHFADMMAESGVTAAAADTTAQGLAEVQAIIAPFMASGRLDAAAVERIVRRGLMVAATHEDDATRVQAIGMAAGDEAQTIMAAAEPRGRTAAGTGAEGLTVPAGTGGGHGNPSRAERMADGLLARMMSGHVPTHGREYASMRLDDMARASNDNFMGRRVGASMFGGAMGTDDFRHALAVASNKVLMDSYQTAESQIKKASRQVAASDFRPIKTVRVSTGVALEKVLENGELKAGTIDDAGEAFAVETYGNPPRFNGVWP